MGGLGRGRGGRALRRVVLREGVEDGPDNVTRFVWIAPEGARLDGEGPWRTSLVFSELGEDHPGALVEALLEFSSREVNLTRIESRPLRRGLGRYMFFIDLEGRNRATRASRRRSTRSEAKAESVRILGSYPVSEIASTMAVVATRTQARVTTAPMDSESCRARRWPGLPGSRHRVLVLNATYEPINVCTVRRATVLVLKAKAEMLERGDRASPLRADGARAPGRDPPGHLRAGPARRPPPQDHPQGGAGARFLDVPVLRHERSPA